MAASSLKRKSDSVDAYQDNGMRTPTGSPSRKKMRITRNQKQALIDNLQLESTLMLICPVACRPTTDTDDLQSRNEPAGFALSMRSKHTIFEHGLRDA